MTILLIQLKRIGDLILTTPAIAALREKFPQAKISLIVSRDGAELLPAIPGVDHGLCANKARSWLKVARGRFHYCIDFTRNDRSAFLTLLSRAEKRVTSGRKKSRAKLRSQVYSEFIDRPLRFLHTIDSNLTLLEPLNIHGLSPPVRLNLPADARDRANELRAAHRIQNRYIIFHPGSARAEKFWKAERWAEVIERTGKNHDVDLVLTGGNSSLEQNHLVELKSKLRRQVVDLSAQTDLLSLAGLVADARLLVTVDSAAMHLAAATHTPQVILFGPTNPFHWRPRDSTALILQGTSTIPVREFSPDQPRVPMKLISTQTVINAMDALLSKPAGRGS